MSDSNQTEPPATDTTDMLGEEHPVWSGSPSQWSNFLPFAAALLLVAASAYAARSTGQPWVLVVGGLATLVAFWRWLRVRTTRIDVTTQRISVRTGVLTRRRRDMELYRVKDTTLVEPFLYRLVSLAHIEVIASDRTTPFLLLPAIRNAESLRQQIRANVERMRVLRRVRELDFQ
jgi:membrane protein YdbS with pleckstrin-like domain